MYQIGKLIGFFFVNGLFKRRHRNRHRRSPRPRY